MKQSTLLLWINTFLLAGLLVGLIWIMQTHFTSTTGEATVPVAKMRDYAAMLKANQLYSLSAQAYDRYLESAPLTDLEKARVDFNTGMMLLENAGDPEGALAKFLRVTEYYQDVDPEIEKESRRLSAECLEKLGRSGAAERQLIASSQLKVGDATEEAAPVEESEVLARIGERIALSRSEFDQAWESLPANLRQMKFPDPDGKTQFLDEMVSMKLMADAARRKGLDRKPEIHSRMQSVEESLLSMALMQEEVAAQVQLSDSDLDLFYKAHRNHYRQPGSLELAHIECSDATHAEIARSQILAGSDFNEVARSLSENSKTRDKGGVLGKVTLAVEPLDTKETTPFDPYQVAIPGLGSHPEILRALDIADATAQIQGPVPIEGRLQLFKVLSRTESKERSFDESKQQVESEMRMMKEHELQTKLVADLIRTNRVTVYKERLKN
jgi:tetratricopeptide (TPR) repeat protein